MFIRKFLVAIIALMFCLSQVPSAYAMSAKYDQVISQNNETIGTFTVLLKDGKSRTESDLIGMKTIMIKNDVGAFSYRPDQNAAIKIPDDGFSGVDDSIAAYQEYLEKNQAVKIGEETIDGLACIIYEYTEPSTQQKAKTWLWEEKKFPVRIEVPSSDGTMVIEFKNIDLDIDIPDSTFELPEAVQIVDMQDFVNPQQQ